jgi:hypothetical protein
MKKSPVRDKLLVKEIHINNLVPLGTIHHITYLKARFLTSTS